MMFTKTVVPVVALFAVMMGGLQNSHGGQPRLTDYVYPYLDSANSRWFYFDSASLPFGMVNLSPDTDVAGAWGTGYRYNSTEIKGFSHVHAWQLAALSVLPVSGEDGLSSLKNDYFSLFSHDTEVVTPGYHQVVLDRYGITAELTATTRVGMHRYTYQRGTNARIMVPLSGRMGPTAFTRGVLQQVGPRSFSGYVMNGKTHRRPKETPVYFHIELDTDLKSLSTWQGDTVADRAAGVEGKKAGVMFDFGAVEGPIVMKVAISYTSAEGAQRNMAAELNHWDFDQVAAAASDQWEQQLQRIKVEGKDLRAKVRFYTDLWHALQGRRIISDADGRYADMTTATRKIKRIALDQAGRPRHNHYNYDSFWGAQWTIQTLWPLVYPEVSSGFVNSMINYYRDGGMLARGPSGGNYTYVMTGAQATPFIVSNYMKGIRDFDTQAALAGMLSDHSSGGIMAKAGYEHKSTVGGDLDHYIEKGYAAYPLPKKPWAYHKSGAMQTLEYAYQDYALAQFALAQGDESAAAQYLQRSHNWENLFDDETGFIRPKNKRGDWKTPFDPAAVNSGYVEANAYQASWWVPHDLPGLAAKMGGVEKAITRLNAQFESAEKNGFTAGNKHMGVKELSQLGNRTQVNYGNQPSMQMAYIFHQLGAPWLTQYWLDKVNSAVYSKVSPDDGYNGDEDQGLMGALSVLMKVGLFQISGVELDPKYLITAPVFDKISIDLSEHYYGGGSFTIIARDNAADRPYIQSAVFNGKPLAKLELKHSQLVAGGILELTMSEQPNKQQR